MYIENEESKKKIAAICKRNFDLLERFEQSIGFN